MKKDLCEDCRADVTPPKIQKVIPIKKKIFKGMRRYKTVCEKCYEKYIKSK